MVSVRRAADTDVESCVGILSQLPDYFTVDTHEELRASMPQHLAWVALDEADASSIVGFVLAERRFPRSAEITFAAVRPERRGGGVGTLLVEQALAECSRLDIHVVEVKTLDASANYEPYVATRAFWEARGFVQVDCIDPLPGWQPGNPSAVYVAALRPTR